MAIKPDLQWVSRLEQFDPAQQKILYGLSADRYQWRSRERLINQTGMEPYMLDRSLAQLIRLGLVKPAFSKQKNIVYGLRERVDRD